MQRRRFIQAAAVSLSPFPHHLFAGTSKAASDRVKLGPMKVELSRLAMGTGTNGAGGSSNQTKKLGRGGIADLFKTGFDNGVTVWDSADQYGSHPHLKEGLKGVPREKVTILSKTRASTYAEAKADVDRFRREIGTDYLDILLLHCMMDGNWDRRKKGAMEYIAEAREKGILRTQGPSCPTL
jgi:aryl-alcohol dehydrogenase-like predicted oxidoreductase